LTSNRRFIGDVLGKRTRSSRKPRRIIASKRSNKKAKPVAPIPLERLSIEHQKERIKLVIMENGIDPQELTWITQAMSDSAFQRLRNKNTISFQLANETGIPFASKKIPLEKFDQQLHDELMEFTNIGEAMDSIRKSEQCCSHPMLLEATILKIQKSRWTKEIKRSK